MTSQRKEKEKKDFVSSDKPHGLWCIGPSNGSLNRTQTNTELWYEDVVFTENSDFKGNKTKFEGLG